VVIAAIAAQALAARGLESLLALHDDLDRLTEGQIQTPVEGCARPDEIGDLARGVEMLRRSLLESHTARESDEERRRETLTRMEASVGSVVAAVTRGDLSARVEAKFDEPELMALANGVNRMADVTAGFLKTLDGVVARMAEGDLTRRCGMGFGGEFAHAAQALDAALERISGLIAEIGIAASAGRASVYSMEESANDLSSRAETQAAAIEETAATMAEIATSVSENARALEDADKLARNASGRTLEGAKAAAAAVAAVARIKGGADKINDIVAMIDGIAFQTNLLALNASVEAARAGEAGRGFAVVASEVRALAQKTSDAANDITTLIGDSNASVTEGLERVELAGTALEGIKDAITSLAERIAVVSASGKEQAAGVSQITAAVGEMDRATQRNAALTEKVAGDSARLGTSIERLTKAADAFSVTDTGARAAA
jgi:methyl-accepting chemotaxis protein